MPKDKLKRKRVPNKYWPDIQARYNAIHGTDLNLNALRVRACREDVTVLEAIADVVEEKQQQAIKDSERVEAKLRKVNMLESNAKEVI